MISFMKKLTLSIIYILTLSGCGLEQDSYLVRWWNGNIPTKLSDEEKNTGYLLWRNKIFTGKYWRGKRKIEPGINQMLKKKGKGIWG